jgi:hypothetical protein
MHLHAFIRSSILKKELHAHTIKDVKAVQGRKCKLTQAWN